MFGARQMRNCLPCKKRKIKCDRRIPCGPCALRRDGKSCTPASGKMEDIADEPDTYVSARDFKLLAQHVESLQARVESLERGIDYPGGAGTSSMAGSSRVTGVKRKADTPDDDESPPPLIRSRKHVGDDEMVYALEDFQMSHRINSLRNLGNSPDVATTPANGGSTHNAYGLQGVDFSSTAFTDSHPLAFIIPPDTDYISKALESLPDQPTCELLIQAYFDNVEWFQKCLHRPTFMGQCRQLWRDERDGLSPGFICSYIMAVCLGLRTVSDSLPATSNALGLAHHLYQVAEGVLWCSRFMSRHSFESLQAISLMSIYGYGMEDGGDATWTLCGTAIKIAQNLGLNRLEAEGPDKDWPPQWNTLLKREMARRVWWTFVSLDWAHAIAHGATYSIHPGQNTTALPSNLDDDELDDPNATAHPLSTYTPISMHIFRHKFMRLYREITDHVASRHNPSYSFILSMDDSIIELANSLPKHFSGPSALSPDTDSSLLIESIFLNVTANTRLVRLHRPFFVRGYHERRYGRSKDRCVSAAHEVLGLIDLAKHRAPVLLTFWIVLFYAFSAAIPVCIDLLLEPTDQKRRVLETVLDTFREQSVTSPAARNSVFVLQRLLESEAAFTNATKRPDGSPAETPGREHDMLKSTIRSILESATFKRPAEPILQPTLPAAAEVDVITHPDIPRMFDPLSPVVSMPTVDATGSASSEPVPLPNPTWPAFSFDMFDTLWTQNESTAWPLQ